MVILSLDGFNFNDGACEEFMLNHVENGPSARPLFEEVLEGAGSSDGLLYEELMKGWNALDVAKQEEFSSCLIDELR